MVAGQVRAHAGDELDAGGVDRPQEGEDRPRACSTRTPANGTPPARGCSTGRVRRWPRCAATPAAVRSGPWSPTSSAPGTGRPSTRGGSPAWGSATAWGTAIRWSARRCRGSGWTTAAGRLELLRGSSEGAGVSGLLVRPDGFVAWASATGGTAGLEAALTRWLGDARKG
ncbi:hypothetical protein [Streptomyces goshikiensis]|uniref:aromatic-ring hydroxylase C-terminal domain-containing protein n=1 Tax=Streptomyces goshikiensis TaxID=1942 RepID=UPI002F9134DB